ncbi:MAG TPA: hypothetical protein VHE61_22430 [Opitutaceae bacterium]|nr:hypothetical protein [Opitutaceae bacterium]
MYGIESATYSVVESMEWKTLREAYLQCSHQNAESEKRDQRRNRRQAESVVE